MSERDQINEIHETLNDVFIDLHKIPVTDDPGREAKQSAFASLIQIRKQLEGMGMGHAMIARRKP